ncbi:energy transducer TonB [Paludibacter jiangxiensis]|uniref:TonB family C-terminal domain-containing protein n=1 Tax=Paludibacter jiangxiensis TaxID=681398 RepID=A0A171ATH5_9BACT|nr:energy transducer TonB [Paludibacter jiangxiensis]GAT64246.1 TonB family C-terminal domain-containing protein [Paludibacter jiangxiensis]
MKKLTLHTRIRFLKYQSFGFGVLFALTKQRWFFERKIATGIVLLSLMNLLNSCHNPQSNNQINIPDSIKPSKIANQHNTLNNEEGIIPSKKNNQPASLKYQASGKKPSVNYTCYLIIEPMPEFPGGYDSLQSFIARNLQYPRTAQENGIQGRVVVQFTIDTDGSITNVHVIRSVDPALDNEAIRVVKTMPKWKPGTNKNKPVAVQYTCPFNFNLK